MKCADLRALQISTRRLSLRRACTLKATLTHLNMSCARSYRVGVLYIVTGAPRSSEPLPVASAVQVSSIVHVPAFVSNTQDSCLQACFVITNPLKCEAARTETREKLFLLILAQEVCANLSHFRHPLGIRI